MERFYKIGILVAIIFLIVCLIGIGILMQNQNAGMKFPIHPNVCPDTWNISADGLSCKVNANNDNKGTSNGDLSISTLSTTCDKKKWSKQNVVNWDGVSNFNGC